MNFPPIELGQVRGPFAGRLDPGLIARYADATNDPNPRYRDGTAVPVTFPVILVFDAQTAANSVIPREVFEQSRATVHGEHDIVLHRPLVPGEELATFSEASAIRITSAGTRVILRFEMRDRDDRVAVEQWWTTFVAGVELGQDAGPEPLDHTFPEPARADAIATYSVHIDRDQPTRYAEVSGDWSSHHFDQAVAEREGFAEVFLHGLCTMAMCAQAAVETVADSDPTRVRRLAVRFASPTMLGRDLDVAVFRVGEHEYAFEADCDGVTVIKHGRAALFAPTTPNK